MRMKIGSYIFATLTFGALTTNVSLAGHHHRNAHHGTGAASVQQGSGLTLQGVPQGTTDTPNGGSEGSGPHLKTDAKTNGPQEGEKDKTLVRGNHGIAPTAGGSNEDGTSSPIDTSITVYQRRGQDTHKELKELKDLKMRLGIKSNTSVTPGTVAAPGTVFAGTDRAHQHARNHHHAPALGANKGAQTRNAIGALVDHGKTADHHATGPTGTGGTAPNAAVAAPVPAPQVSGTTGPAVGPVQPKTAVGPVQPKTAVGPVQPDSAGPAEPHIVGHAPANGLSIGGTAVIHPGFGPGVIGGPVKNLAGINGTGFQIKHR
jgi:hypothetical protein